MPRKQRDYKAEYQARKARGRAAGLSPAEAVGKRERDYAREYRDRVAREVAAGKRKPPRSRPRNNQAPTGVPLAGARRFDGEDSAFYAERFLNRLRSDRTVFLYVRGWLNGDSVDLQLFPKGGIRAQSLRREIAAAGSLEQLVLNEIGIGTRISLGDDPAVNPQNRFGKSGSLRPPDDDESEIEFEFDYVVLQWT